MIRRALKSLLVLALPAFVMPLPVLADPCPDIPGTEETCVSESPWYMANQKF